LGGGGAIKGREKPDLGETGKQGGGVLKGPSSNRKKNIGALWGRPEPGYKNRKEELKRRESVCVEKTGHSAVGSTPQREVHQGKKFEKRNKGREDEWGQRKQLQVHGTRIRARKETGSNYKNDEKKGSRKKHGGLVGKKKLGDQKGGPERVAVRARQNRKKGGGGVRKGRRNNEKLNIRLGGGAVKQSKSRKGARGWQVGGFT